MIDLKDPIFLALLHKELMNQYPSSHMRKKKVATECVESVLSSWPLSFETLGRFQELYRELYIFYVLKSHNNRDELTHRSVKKMHELLYKLNYNHSWEVYEQGFHMHKKRNLNALKQVLILLDEAKKRYVSVVQFTKIPGVGMKSASLIANEFLDGDFYPVIDVNVLKGFQTIFPEYKKLNALDLFNLMISCDSTKCGRYLCYQIASMLYYHRKKCIRESATSTSCKVQTPCETCFALKNRVLSDYNVHKYPTRVLIGHVQDKKVRG